MNIHRIVKISRCKVILLCLIFIGSVLRLWKLPEFPVGFHGDEASFGYNAYSILKTGKSQDGVFLPTVLDQWGDYRPAGYVYLATISVGLFGLNEFAVRFPSAFFGILTIPLFYILCKRYFKKESLALIASAIITFSPWHIVTSRASSESIVSVFIILLAALLFYEFLISGSKVKIIFTYIILFFSQFFYHAARIVSPLYAVLMLLYIVISHNNIKRNYCSIKIGVISVILFLCATVGLFIISSGGERATQVSIFSQQESRLLLEEQIREDQFQNVLITQIFHNKITSYLITFSKNYFEYFSGNFLFLTGGFPHRYSVPNTGMMYIFDIFFLVLGFVLVCYEFFYKKSKYIPLLVVFLFVGPAIGAFTYEDIPNIQRSIFMVIGLVVVAAFGYDFLYGRILTSKIKILIPALLIIQLYFVILFFHNYFHHSKVHRPWYRAVSEKELTLSLLKYSNKKIPIVTTTDGDNVQIFYLFYWKIDPFFYQSLGLNRQTDLKTLLNITFIQNPCPLYGEITPVKQDTIFVNRAFCDKVTRRNVTLLKKINKPDGNGDYFIYLYKADK